MSTKLVRHFFVFIAVCKRFCFALIDVVSPICCVVCGKEIGRCDEKNETDQNPVHADAMHLINNENKDRSVCRYLNKYNQCRAYDYENEHFVHNFLCSDCQKLIFKIDQNNCCKRCGYPHEDYLCDNWQKNFLDKNDKICPSCQDFHGKHFFNMSRSSYKYKTKLRSLLMNFKFYFQTDMIDFFANSLFQTYLTMPKADIVCYVPISRWKLLAKGYNHAGLLANNFFNILKKYDKQSVMFNDLILKDSKTIASKKLSQQERWRKKYNFSVNKKYLSQEWRDFFYGKTILLIDDIMTTGATLNATSKTLKEEFANVQIECLTLARTMLY